MTRFTFVWSPEGRAIGSTDALNQSEAMAWFRRNYPNYARFMGEVYWTTEKANG